LSANADPISQLFQASLRRRDEKIYGVWQQYSSQFVLDLQPYDITLSLPGAVALASVIEKEERNIQEKPTIAGIFLNRLQNDIAL
jgi:cell division protein YceG involved in septum cleavage